MSESVLAASSKDPRIGQIVQERYRIVRKIGEGGMGAVYEGEHTVIRRKVAIKCLHAQYATNQEMVNRFQREAMASNAIRHPNIVEVTDMGRFEDGAVFMVLEFLEGRELSDVIKKDGALSLARIVHIASQVCDALGAAHEQSIVHRDLKPDNIYICPRSDEDPDFVKVLDFGIAKFRESGGGQGMTRTGMTMGTPNYMAPEQAQASKDLDHRADVYSLGVILFHLITGVLPYDDESFPMLMVKLVSYPAPRMSTLCPEIPPALDELVDRMLSKVPSLRPANCREVKAALAPFRGVHTSYAAGQAPKQTSIGYAGTDSSGPTTPAPSYTGPLGAGSSPQLQPPSNVGYGSNPQQFAQGSQPGYGSSPQLHAGSNPSASAVEVRRSGVPVWLLAVAGLVVVLGGGAAFVGALALGEDDTPPPVVVRTGPATPPDPPPDPAPDPRPTEGGENGTAPVERPPPDPVPAPAQESVRVQVSVQPGGAELFLDGNPIANPFDADLPQTSVARRLEARLAGHRTHVQDLVLIYPQRVAITLRRGSGVDDQRRVRSTTPEPTGPRPLTPTGPATPTPTGPATPPPPDPPEGRRGDGFLNVGI